MRLKQRLSRLPPSPSSGSRAPSLDTLRSHLDEALAPSATGASADPPEALAAPPAWQALGFVPARDEHSYLRREVVVTERCVGRVRVASSLGAAPRLLSLLAVDPAVAAYIPENTLLLDTETTGLGGGAGTYAFLLGLGRYRGQELRLQQWFLPGPEHERDLLVDLAAALETIDTVVTFNGKSYDWPLLENRFVLNRLPVPKRRAHLDLLHVARRVHRTRLQRTSLQHLERDILGFERQGDVPGAEVAGRYAHYLRTGDHSGLVDVAIHNEWDVLTMMALIGLYGHPGPDPRSLLTGADWVDTARTFRRARGYDEALSAAEQAASRGAAAASAHVRGEVHKALGERDQALAAFRAAAQDEASASSRLELAKLYEHHLRDPAQALLWTQRGTGETPQAEARREGRLRRKLAARKPQPR